MEENTTTQQAPAAKKKSNVLLIVIIVLVVLLSLCGLLIPRILGGAFKGFLGSKGINYDKSGNVNIKTDDGEYNISGDSNSGTIKTDQGEFTYGEDLQLPADFPKNIPVMSGAKIVSATSKTSDGTSMIIFTIEKSNQEAYDYYKSEMPKNGWTEQATYSGQMLTYENDTQSAAVIISSDSDTAKTSVSISVSKK